MFALLLLYWIESCYPVADLVCISSSRKYLETQKVLRETDSFDPSEEGQEFEWAIIPFDIDRSVDLLTEARKVSGFLL